MNVQLVVYPSNIPVSSASLFYGHGCEFQVLQAVPLHGIVAVVSY